MFPNFRVELIPKATGNGYGNMQIVMFEKECPVVCLQSTRSPVNICQRTNSNHEYYHSHYHCFICAASARIEVRGKQVFILFFRDLLHRHSDLKVTCSNLTIDNRFYLQKHILYNCFCFENYINDL
jgi:hypothetical protein